jgi:uncharacterized protein YlxW (UPF0749 family)
MNHLTAQVTSLQKEVAQLKDQVKALTAESSQMQQILSSKRGTITTIETQSGSITGTILVAGTDAVEIQEQNGNIVLIPYKSIESVI